MTQDKNDTKSNVEWGKILEDYPIVETVKNQEFFHITGREIRKYREPRLMAKWDSEHSLPANLKKNHLNILPIRRGSYIIYDFLLYHPLLDLAKQGKKITRLNIPFNLESIDVNNIHTEAVATNALSLSGALDDFLGIDENMLTFNGRMASGNFSFQVDTFRKQKTKVAVNNAQLEIDGGFENKESVVIIEAKNKVNDDFHVRQLYYPYRLWKTKVKKPIRLVFSLYKNMIFSLYEYRFHDEQDYSSIELVQSKRYSFQDTNITLSDLRKIRAYTRVVTDDNQDNTTIPFIQANSMERIISLLEILYEKPLTLIQIAEKMDFEPRQSDYYYNAGRYLGLFEKNRNNKEGKTVVKLTDLGNEINKMNYIDRQMTLLKQILEHRIFADFFDFRIKNGVLPEQNMIADKMRELNVCAEGQVIRRAGSVSSWLDWIFRLTK